MSPVLKWLIASAGRSFTTAVPEQLRLLPLLFKVTFLLWLVSASSSFLNLNMLPFLQSFSNSGARDARGGSQ